MRPILLVCCLFLFALSSPAQGQSSNDIVVGKKFFINSEHLDETREYWVSLPASYHDDRQAKKTYPVLIILDGRSLFRSLSGVMDFMSTSWGGSRRVPEMITVGLLSTNRERDYTPDKVITKRVNDTGGGDQFLKFLEQELLPNLEKKYRTAPFNILAGHSLGGLLAVHTYLKAETAFNAFIAVDPSFGTWDVETMDKKIEAVTDKSFDRFLYIATANWGTRNLRNRDRHVRLYEALNKTNPGSLFRAQLAYYENEHHGSVPLIAFYEGMSAMFDGYGLSYRDVKSPEQLTTHYATISDRLSFNFPPPQELVNRSALSMLRSDDPQLHTTAIALLTLNTVNYPASFKTFEELATAYAKLGQKQEAISNYQQSLVRNPDNTFARSQLKKLEESK